MNVCMFLCVSVYVSLSVDCRSQVLFKQLVKERAVGEFILTVLPFDQTDCCLTCI